ncbi:hypothetical protein JCM16138_11290 [Thermococcus atlanticus]
MVDVVIFSEISPKSYRMQVHDLRVRRLNDFSVEQGLLDYDNIRFKAFELFCLKIGEWSENYPFVLLKGLVIRAISIRVRESLLADRACNSGREATEDVKVLARPLEALPVDDFTGGQKSLIQVEDGMSFSKDEELFLAL